ncbi:MAG: cytochrome c biogenesis protein CcsA [Ignavibacteriae bacterium]|nr:cytochrome c biogenesis protein CcsA [Ignavibacteriota bacterium]
MSSIFIVDMRFFITLLQILLPLCYFATIWAYAKGFFRNERVAEVIKRPLLGLTLLLHTIYIVARTLEYFHPPITSVFELFSLIAFTIGLAYVYIELRTKITSTGYFILMLPFFFQLFSSMFTKEIPEIPEILRSHLLGFHVTSALLGYAAITISAVYGFLYLMLYHDIKSSQFGVIYKRLPNLEMLERMSFTATVFGFILLTIAIIVGLIWLPRITEDISFTDPKLFGTIVIWLIYASGLTAKRLGGWQGRRMMVLSVFGFTLTIFSMTIINMFFSEFHRFY